MIRIASAEDIASIQSLAKTAFRKTYARILSPAQMEYMMDMMYSRGSLEKQMTAEDNRFFIEDGRGYVSFRPDGRTEDGRPRFHLEKLYVVPEYQKTGLGRKLFETVVREAGLLAAGEGYRIELNVNRENPAVNFYEHIGMYKDRQGDFPIGEGFYMNDYIMAMDLPGV